MDNLCGSSAAMPVDHSYNTGNAYFIFLQVDKYLIYIIETQITVRVI